MAKIISTPKISEILLEEFMNPLQISAYRLAMDIHVPTSRILEILHDRRKITADTSIRLGRYFGVSDSYFLNLQSDIDMRSDAARAERGSGRRVAQPTRLRVLKPQANESTE
ncbi:MAG: HigA family addiction module antidote protein [Acidaminococcaceae bacterium]|nr:HigA family addiction module antidote protein [Acidaminococcaceae bacterium]